MERCTILCDSCERLWTLGCSLTIYEQQALEARPCPHCGAYTLRCQAGLERAEAATTGRSWTTFVA